MIFLLTRIHTFFSRNFVFYRQRPLAAALKLLVIQGENLIIHREILSIFLERLILLVVIAAIGLLDHLLPVGISGAAVKEVSLKVLFIFVTPLGISGAVVRA